jgi:CHAD domain-containing protein
MRRAHLISVPATIPARHALPATPWLDRLSASLPVARAGVDPEGVHQVRVSTGRLRVWLDLGGWRVLGDDLRWLRHRAEAVRDLDVHLAGSPPSRVEHHLRARRSTAQDDLCRALAEPRVDALLLALSLVPPVPRRRANRKTAHLACKALERCRRAFRSEAPAARLHEARQAVRCYRYAVEWAGPCPMPVVSLQDLLGEVCDRWLALRDLKDDAHRGREIDRYRNRLRHERRDLEHDARQAWRDAQRVLAHAAHP